MNYHHAIFLLQMKIVCDSIDLKSYFHIWFEWQFIVFIYTVCQFYSFIYDVTLTLEII